MAGLITDISIEEGMEVAEGQVLARLDSSNLDRSLRLAEAQADAARKAVLEVEAQLAEARLRQDRTRRLVEQQVAGQADLDRVGRRSGHPRGAHRAAAGRHHGLGSARRM